MANRDVTDVEELNRLMGDAEESASFLQSNVMQANLNEETGNYGAQLHSEECAPLCTPTSGDMGGATILSRVADSAAVKIPESQITRGSNKK